MFSLKGRIRLVFKDEISGTTRQIEEENIIHDATLLLILGFQPNLVFLVSGQNTRIAISSQTSTPTAANNTLTGILASGDIPAGTTSPQWFESVTPNFGQIINQYPAPGTPRTFNSLGLVNRPPNNNEGGVSAPALTTSLLSASCTQQGTEILTIYYFIEISQLASSRFTPRFLRDFGGRLFGIKSCRPEQLGFSYAGQPPNNSPYIDAYHDNVDIVISAGTGWNTGATNNTHFKWKQTREFTIANSGIVGQTDQEIGRIFNTALVGLSNGTAPNGTSYIGGPFTENTSSCYRIDRYRPQTIANLGAFTPKQPPFQPIWGKRPSYTAPFFEPTFPARGSGIINFQGTWVSDFPSMYRVELVVGGAVAAATYRIAKRYHLGFSGNNWTNRLVGLPYRNPNTPAFESAHGWRNEDNDLLRVSNTRVLQYDATGITLLDLLTGEYRNWDTTTTPALPILSCRQCAVDTQNQIAYAACRQTGLWSVNLASGAVTQILNTACYGVDIGFNGVVYAIFEGSLRSSVNWSLSLSITFTGLTDSNWAQCLYLKANPSNSQQQLGIVIQSSANRRIVWWRGDTQATLTGNLGTSVGQWAASFDVSDTGDFWADVGGFRHTFGTSTVAGTGGTSITRSITHSIWGSVSLGKVTFWGSNLVCIDRLVNSAGTTVVAYSSLASGTYWTTLHMVGGILCLGYRMQSIAPQTYSATWESFGFVGGAWISGNTTTKVTHTSSDALIDGLQISFANGTSAPHFVAGDEYLTTMCLGTLKDNSIATYYENYWYTRPVYFDVAVPAGVVVVAGVDYQLPAALSSTFLRIESDSIDYLAAFTLNGVAVLKIWVDGTAPNAGEVRINPTTGMVTFNAADVGKTFAGTYSWVGS